MQPKWSSLRDLEFQLHDSKCMWILHFSEPVQREVQARPQRSSSRQATAGSNAHFDPPFTVQRTGERKRKKAVSQVEWSCTESFFCCSSSSVAILCAVDRLGQSQLQVCVQKHSNFGLDEHTVHRIVVWSIDWDQIDCDQINCYQINCEFQNLVCVFICFTCSTVLSNETLSIEFSIQITASSRLQQNLSACAHHQRIKTVRDRFATFNAVHKSPQQWPRTISLIERWFKFKWLGLP